jgi:RNA polymerase sigma-70 factor (ECF subfamily)
VTDEALMTAVRNGDLAKLGPLFERYHVALFDFLSRMTGDRTAAEDLVQDVFLRILKYRATFRDGGSFETWLFRIARNARADHFRRRATATHVSDETFDAAAEAPGPSAVLEQEQQVEQLRQALLQLREDRRELIVLARYRGMKYEQIAELLDVDVGTIKVRMHRAMNELRGLFLRMTEGNRPCDVKMPPRTLRIV